MKIKIILFIVIVIAALSIAIVVTANNGKEKIMDKNTFWKLIEKTSAKDTDTHYINLLKEIKKLSLKDAVRFGSILSIYTEYSQSTASYIACRLINGSASDDTELYFRLWLISKGKKIFFETLKNPDTLAGIKTAEEGVESWYYGCWLRGKKDR